MIALTPDEVWSLTHNIYILYGRRISLPPGTKREKTYQWRYIMLLANKFHEWGFDAPMAERYLHIVLRYAQDRKLLHKGMALHFQSNLLRLCYDELKAELEMSHCAIYGLRKSQKWVVSIAPHDTIGAMLHREHYGGHTNLIKWYLATKLTDHYLALSKLATRAIKQLPPSELEHIPNDASLWLTRTEFLANQVNVTEALLILKEDLKHARRHSTTNPNHPSFS